MKINKKALIIILICLGLFILADVVLALVFMNKKGNTQKLGIATENPAVVEEFIYCNSEAKNSFIKESSRAQYEFSNNQRIILGSSFEKNSNAALVIRVGLSLSEKQAENFQNKKIAFEYGFFTKQDGQSNIVIKADETSLLAFNQTEGMAVIDFSLAFAKKPNGSIQIPDGFYVSSDCECRIISAYIGEAVIGFDLSSEVPFFGYSSNGGYFDNSFKDFDFTGGSLIFAPQNTKIGFMPDFIIKLSDKTEHLSTLEKSIFVKLNVGGEKIKVKNVAAAKELTVPTATFKDPFTRVEISENRVCVEGILMKNPSNYADAKNYVNEVIIPVRTEPGLILDWNVNNWRNKDYELYEWDRFPGILYFDTRNYTVQDNFFRRLAFFAEKEGYKGKLLTNEELGSMHGFNALDYRPETFADFFNLAAKTKFQLNPEELLLKKILLKNGLLIADGEFVKPGAGAVVSISQESYSSLRWQLVAHEAWHTLFFIDEEFRNFVAAVYYTMDPLSLEFLIDYFKSQTQLGYDTKDDYLMKNEFMAYLLQQGVGNIGQYFVNHANWGTVRAFTPYLCDYVIRTNGAGFEEAGVILNDFIFDKYGLIAGNIALISRN